MLRVRNLNFTYLMGAGILHTKLWIVDNKHFYVGSANFDWRSLTQVKNVDKSKNENSILNMSQNSVNLFINNHSFC